MLIGKCYGEKPSKMEGFTVTHQDDLRNASFSWEPLEGGRGY